MKDFTFRKPILGILLEIRWSKNGLWWNKFHQTKKHYLLDVSIIERSYPEDTYRAIQLIVGKLAITMGKL